MQLFRANNLLDFFTCFLTGGRGPLINSSVFRSWVCSIDQQSLVSVLLLFHNVIGPYVHCDVLHSRVHRQKMWQSVLESSIHVFLVFLMLMPFTYFTTNSPTIRVCSPVISFPWAFCFQNNSQSLPCFVWMRGYQGHPTKIQGPAAVVQVCFQVLHLVFGEVYC